MNSPQKKILLLENIHPVAKERLTDEGFDVTLLSHALGPDDLVKTLPDYHAVGLRSKTQITKEAIAKSPKLMAIGAFCIGTNQIDLEFANQTGTPVFNAPYSNTRSVAEMMIAEMVALARQLGDRSAKAHQGIWTKSAVGNHEIRGKTLGIIGYGHIGSQVSVLAEAMGLRVLFYDIVKKLPLGNSQAVGSLQELMNQSDFVTLHVPATPETKEMIGEREIGWMKEKSYLINASRGNVVIIPALVEALKSGRLRGAAIDVFPEEPKSNEEKFFSQLQGLPNVILTPHIGGSTEEAQEMIGREVSESLTRYLKLGITSGAVNFPNVELPPVKEAHRLVNIHQNVPGVLGEINGLVSELGANIKGQFLSTDANIGYLVMDVVKADAKDLEDRVKKLKTSLKTFVLY